MTIDYNSPEWKKMLELAAMGDDDNEDCDCEDCELCDGYDEEGEAELWPQS
jgi:hypothetical protein